MAVNRIQKIEDSLHLPRILCLHGGGTNATVFRMQSRSIIHYLKDSFRFVFVDAPFLCEAHPAILPVYEDHGPYRRWLRTTAKHPPIHPDTLISKIDHALKSVMHEDDLLGAAGEWVGLMGFSQGAKIAASLLYRQQVREEKLGIGKSGSRYRFAVLVAGRAPLISFDAEVITSSAIIDAGQSSEEFLGWPDDWEFEDQEHMLNLPTIHVHGLQDPGLNTHRRLLKQYCRPGSTKMMEWDGGHRMPIKTQDVKPLVEMMLQTARETGVVMT